MTPHEVRIKDLTPSGLRELADAQCTVWAQSVHDPSIIIFLKPEPHDLATLGGDRREAVGGRSLSTQRIEEEERHVEE